MASNSQFLATHYHPIQRTKTNSLVNAHQLLRTSESKSPGYNRCKPQPTVGPWCISHKSLKHALMFLSAAEDSSRA